MPFVNRLNGSILTLACLQDEKLRWKVHTLDNTSDEYVRIDTGADPGCVECPPSFYDTGDGFILSYIAGGNADVPRLIPYKLYTRKFDYNFKPVSDPLAVCSTFAGFVSKWGNGRIEYDGPEKSRIVIQINGTRITLESDAKIYRISYHPGIDRCLLISGSAPDEFSVRYYEV